jgi:hypothetical protein
MRQTNLRRLEALEREHRSREQNHDGKELPVAEKAEGYVCIIVLAYYLGGLKLDVPPDRLERSNVSPDKRYPGDSFAAVEAYARALQYASADNWFVDAELDKRINDAFRRLFANVGLDVHMAAPNELCEALATMINNLSKGWLDWLKENCGDGVIVDGSNLSRLFFVRDDTALG